MSYILDALRRADAERRRGQAPALQQVAAGSTPAPGHDGRPAARIGLALVAALLMLAAAAGWWWSGRKSTPPAPSPAVVAPSPPVAAPAAAPAPAPVVPAPAPPPMAAAPTVPAPPRPKTPKVPNEARLMTPPPAAAAASGPPPGPLAASALPEPRRSAVAQLGFGGAVHSQDRSQSFVLVGGQIVHEGATLAPGIVLERIQPRSLLLRVDERLVELPL